MCIFFLEIYNTFLMLPLLVARSIYKIRGIKNVVDLFINSKSKCFVVLVKIVNHWLSSWLVGNLALVSIALTRLYLHLCCGDRLFSIWKLLFLINFFIGRYNTTLYSKRQSLRWLFFVDKNKNIIYT